MGDILAIANADLQQNNSYVYEYLDHLTANSIFSDMIVANSAIVETIEADTAFIQSIATNSAFVNALSANTAFINSIKASEGFFNNISVTGELVSSDFNIANNRGYKFYKDSGNVGRAVVPILEAKQIKNPVGNQVAIYSSSGLNARYTGTSNGAITNWNNLFSALWGSSEAVDVEAYMVHCSGQLYFSAQSITYFDRITLVRESSYLYLALYRNGKNVISTSWNDRNTPDIDADLYIIL